MSIYYPGGIAGRRHVSKLSKYELADWLADHGTIYPDRKGLTRWTKDELQHAVIDRMRELAENARPVDRCPVCGGLNPGDVTHTRCAS